MSIETNRRNARKSSGPKDTASTRLNAVKHGLLAEGVTELDHPETFKEFSVKIMAELQPVGEIETFLARRIALAMRRCDRAAALEAEFITATINPPITERGGNDLDQMLAELNGQTIVDPGLPARISSEVADTLANTWARYETALENRLCRSLNELERRQQLRKGEKIPAPASADIPVHG